MNCEDPNLVEWFFHNFCLCFDILFAQLRVITKKRSKFVKIVAASERD